MGVLKETYDYLRRFYYTSSNILVTHKDGEVEELQIVCFVDYDKMDEIIKVKDPIKAIKEYENRGFPFYNRAELGQKNIMVIAGKKGFALKFGIFKSDRDTKISHANPMYIPKELNGNS